MKANTVEIVNEFVYLSVIINNKVEFLIKLIAD